MYCEKCGMPIQKGEKYCSRCKAPVEPEEAGNQNEKFQKRIKKGLVIFLGIYLAGLIFLFFVLNERAPGRLEERWNTFVGETEKESETAVMEETETEEIIQVIDGK